MRRLNHRRGERSDADSVDYVKEESSHINDKNVMAIRLSTYRPLCINEHGRQAVELYDITAFLDSS